MAINSSSSGEVVAPPPSTGSSQPTTEVDTDSDVTIETVSTNNGHSSPRVDKIMMAVAVPGRCRRMASLNAQAILAASLCHDEKRPPKKKEPPPAPLTPTTFAPEAPAAATPAVSPRMTPAPGAAMGTPGTGGVVSGPAGSVIKIEDIEDEEKTTTVEEEEIVQIVQTTKIRRRKMKTSKSPSGGQPSPPATPRAAIKTKPLKKSEVLDGDTDDLLELAAMTGVVGKEEREQDIKVAQDSSATVTQAQQVTRTYTYTATSTASGGLTGVPSGVTPTALPAIVRPPLVISQAQSQPTTIPLQNQAASFSYAATVNAQNSNPQGQAAQMQGGTMYMTNMNMANVAASMGNMATVAANVTNITNPGSYATIVTAPHFTVQQPVQASSTPFGIPTAYYQVQPLIHKPIAFHPNGAYVAGGQSTGGVGTVGGANSAAAAGQTRTPARSIVVQVPSTRQQQQQQQQQLAHNNSSGKPSSTSGIQVVVNNTNSGAGGPSGAVGGTAVNCGNSGLLNTSSNNKNNNSSNCNNKPQQQSQQQTQQRPTSIAQPATAGPAAAGAVSGGIPVQQQQQQQQKQQQQQQQTGGVTVLRNPGGRGGVANGGYGSGDVSSAAGGALGVRVSIETAAIACPLAAGAVGAIGGVNSGKRKMQGGPSGAAASGLGSAVAKCERVEKGDNQGREKKSGLLTGGIKVDAPIKTNSPGKRKYHGWSTLGEPFLKRVCTSNDQMHNALVRVCFPLMRHSEGDEVRPRDCVLLKSGPRVIDLPFVAKVGSLWQTTEGDLMISLLWYYRPEHTEQGRRSNHMEDEIFASKHCDFNSVACIEDKCYVLTFAEYCRYRAKVKQLEEGVRSRVAAIVPPLAPTPRQARLPDPGRVSADLVFFCRKVYDYRQKRILKNPTVQIIAKDPNGVGGEGNA
ncbi:uncharacterized protein C1235.01-like isoform X2 [Varroa jacobsoni]|uniref:uncharacterized protein C1235.01-like isoform X2 n=1 Tax=Varroa jacobsoni TaxID=62625 RepID=UPI000BF2B08D|nr:uncharacterized protein C1235.01-like isoform X2 [Varroa jacobsoni]